MYLLMGGETAEPTENIIGIFDLDKTTVRETTRLFINRAEREGRGKTLSIEELPLTFVVCNKAAEYNTVYKKMPAKRPKKSGGKASDVDTVYISPVSAATLKARIENGIKRTENRPEKQQEPGENPMKIR